MVSEVGGADGPAPSGGGDTGNGGDAAEATDLGEDVVDAAEQGSEAMASENKS